MHISILKNAAVAELADAQDLKSCGTYTPVPVRFRSAALLCQIWMIESKYCIMPMSITTFDLIEVFSRTLYQAASAAASPKYVKPQLFQKK